MWAATYWIPPGVPGTRATVATMRRLARAGAMDPVVRQVAAKQVLGIPASWATLQARQIARWVMARTVFLPDPSVAEVLFQPRAAVELALRNGLAQLDCDDVATLAAALGLAIGLRARFVVVGFSSPTVPPSGYQHVWAELAPFLGNGPWLAVDPTRAEQRGLAAPVVRRWIVEV